MSGEGKVEIGDLWKLEEEPVEEEVYYIVNSLGDINMNDSKQVFVGVIEYNKHIGLVQTINRTYIDLRSDRNITDPKKKAFILLQMENARHLE